MKHGMRGSPCPSGSSRDEAGLAALVSGAVAEVEATLGKKPTPKEMGLVMKAVQAKRLAGPRAARRGSHGERAGEEAAGWLKADEYQQTRVDARARPHYHQFANGC